MPLKEVEIVTGPILKRGLQLKVIVHIEYPDLVVHATSGHELAIVVELDELNSLRVLRENLMHDSLEVRGSPSFCFLLLPSTPINWGLGVTRQHLPHYDLVVTVAAHIGVEGGAGNHVHTEN
jgi:hypothetical protein